MLPRTVLVRRRQVGRHRERHHRRLGRVRLDRGHAQRVEPGDRPPVAARLGRGRSGGEIVGQAPPGAVLRRGQRPPEDRGDRGVAVEVGLLVAAPRAQVAVERHARVQVMDQVVVLVDEQRRHPALAAHADARRAVLVLPAGERQPVVRQVVEPPRQHAEAEPLRDEERDRQRGAVPGRDQPTEGSDDGQEHQRRRDDLAAGPLGDAAQVEDEVPEVDRHPAERQLPPRPLARPRVGVDRLLLVGVAVVLDVDEADHAEGAVRRHEGHRQVAHQVVEPVAGAHRVMGGLVQHAEHQERDRRAHRHREPRRPPRGQHAEHLEREERQRAGVQREGRPGDGRHPLAGVGQPGDGQRLRGGGGEGRGRHGAPDRRGSRHG